MNTIWMRSNVIKCNVCEREREREREREGRREKISVTN